MTHGGAPVRRYKSKTEAEDRPDHISGDDEGEEQDGRENGCGGRSVGTGLD